MKKSANHVQSNNEMAIPDGMTVFNTEDVDTNKQHMFFGKPLGVQRYDKYKYPVFDKLTQQQLGYFWRPEEVSYRRIGLTIRHYLISKSTYLLATLSIRSYLTLYRVEAQVWHSFLMSPCQN